MENAKAGARQAGGRPAPSLGPEVPAGRRCLWVLAGWLVASAALEASSRAAWPGPGPAIRPLRSAPDPDRAPPRELRRLPGVGPRLALEIERARWDAGGSLELEDVHGIGPLVARAIRVWLEAQGAELQGPPNARVPPGE